MVRQWSQPYRLFVKCVRGLEGALENELLAMGFPRNGLIRSSSGITIEEGSLKRLYFVSYFSRLCSGVFVEGLSFPVKDKVSFIDSCADIAWKDFLRPDSSFLVDARIRGASSFLHSGLYASQLVKDGILHNFGCHLGMPSPTISLRNPAVKVLLHIDNCDARVLVDAVGAPTSSRCYRYKPALADINPTVAVALLHDMGFTSHESNTFSLSAYEELCKDLDGDSLDQSPLIDLSSPCSATGEANPRAAPQCDKGTSVPRESQTTREPAGEGRDEYTHPLSDRSHFAGQSPDGSIVSMFSGCGTFLIEAAMIAARIAPGTLLQHFSFQNFSLYDAPSFNHLLRYASETRLSADSDAYRSLKKKFIGIESNWEKVEASLYSADKAGVMDLVHIIQSDYLKDGLYDAHRECNKGDGWPFLIAQLPLLKARFHNIPDKSAGSSDASDLIAGSDALGRASQATFRGEDTKSQVQIRKHKSDCRRRLAGSLLDPCRYYQLVNNIGKFRRRFFEADTKCLLVVPSVVQLSALEDSFGSDLRGGRHFVNAGLACTVYHSKHSPPEQTLVN